MMYVILTIGFILLIKGADFFVDGASSIARLLKIPSVIIGLTIVAMGTSAPEAAVSITAALNGSNEIAISNVVGSNIFNLLVVAGFCAVMMPLTVEKSLFKRDFPINILFSFVLLFFVMSGQISRLGGVILLVCMAVYLFITIRSAKKGNAENSEDTASDFYKFLNKKMNSFIPSPTAAGTILSILFCAVGLTAIILGGNMVVNSATDIARTFGVSDTLIGLTIVAIGTSLPELVTSIVASRKGENDIAMGNVIGSNIFNLVFILGISAVLNPITVTANAVGDVGIMTATTILMMILCLGKKKHILNRYEGALCVLAYLAYMAYIIMR